MSKKVKKIKPVPGNCIIEGAMLLDSFSFFYVPEYNRVEIFSHYTGITFCIKSEDLTKFIEDHKQIVFGDF